MFLFFVEQRYNIPGRVVTLLYLPPDKPGKGFAAMPRQVPSWWKEARVHY
jgi:hypothetical protein